jgi:hypothetical protein
MPLRCVDGLYAASMGLVAARPRAKANGAYKHGQHTVEAVEDRRQIRELIRLVNETLGVI